MRKISVAVITLGALLLAGCTGTTQSVVTVTATPSVDPPSETATPVTPTPSTSSSTPQPEPEPTDSPLDVIESGTWVVPNEIEPGVYRVIGYWATLDDDMEIIDNDGVYEEDELSLAVVGKSASYVEISGEAVAISELPRYPVMEVLPPGGTYLVGPDIKPGRYRVSDRDYAYAARLDKNLEIISNEGNEGSVIIVIQEGDFAFEFSGEIKEL